MSSLPYRWSRAATFYVALAIALPGTSPAQVSARDAAAIGQASNASLAAELAEEVGEIAKSSASSVRKEKLISSAVREAILNATTEVQDSAKKLRAVMDLATAAAQAAPRFTDVIAQAASFAEPVAHIENAPARIRAAAYAGTKGPGPSRPPSVVAAGGFPAPAAQLGGAGGWKVRQTSSAVDLDDPMTPAAGVSPDPEIRLGSNSHLTLAAAVGVSHDSNIFLESEDKVSETISSVTPSADFRFGQNSLVHGSMGYKVAITRYANSPDANANLGRGHADFGYTGANLTIAAGASYQESNQATVDAQPTTRMLVRQKTFGSNASIETMLSAKTSLQTGAGVDWTKYKSTELTGSRNLTVPLKLYVAATPKLAVSGGVTYSKAKSEGGVNDSRDWFYNLGIRGTLTEKLISNFSVGYRTREVAEQPEEKLWGFDGSFNYAATPKSNLSLVLSRNFDVGSGGYSLKNSSYFLNFSTAPTLQWQFSGGIGHRDISYGAKVFLPPPGTPAAPLVPLGRTDSYWESNLRATYVFTNWFNVTAAWTQRHNDSNEENGDGDFADTILSLMLVFQY